MCVNRMGSFKIELNIAIKFGTIKMTISVFKWINISMWVNWTK